MALQAVDGYGTSHPLGVYYLTAELTDISTASEAWVTVPHKGGGKVIRVESILHGAITAADAVLTAEINGTAITGVSITVANSGSAGGVRDTGTPTAANTVAAGDALSVVSDGASTTAARCTVVFTIERE